MTISVLICFLLVGKVPVFLVAVFLAKDLILCLGALVLLRHKEIVVYSDIFGKIATYIFSVGLALTFFEGTSPLNMYILYGGMVIALIAFVRYSAFAVRQLFFKQ